MDGFWHHRAGGPLSRWTENAATFLSDAAGHLGEPWGGPRRYRVAFLVHAVAAPLVVLAPTAHNYVTVEIFRTEPARTAIWQLWLPASCLVVALAVVGALIPAREEGSVGHVAQRALMLAIVGCALVSNGVTVWLYGSLTSASAAIFIALIACYRVFIDYVQGLAMTVGAAIVWVALVVAELQGAIALHPLAPGLEHPAYFVPEVTFAMIQGGPATLLLMFIVTNYGVNQSVKLHRYITDSVLRRYLPESLVRRAARGELDLDGPPERREVTVLFTDLVGFTALSERLGAVAVGALLNRYLGAVADVAHQHGATVDKFVGDGVMMVFGAPEPLAPEEQARRAANLAREIRGIVAELGGDETLEARSGINTGEVVVGNFGSTHRSDYTVIGPAVNVAARLEAASAPGRILVGERTAVLLGLKGEPIELGLKGVSGAVKAWFVDD